MPLTFTTVPGTVKLLNASGNDTTITNSAIVSDTYTGIISPDKKHERLFEEMFQSGHWGTLDHCFLTFRIECPIFVARQLMRSSNMNFNELSMRYLESDGTVYIPDMFYQDVKRKDLGGEPEELVDQDQLDIEYKNSIKMSWNTYHSLLSQGVRKEQARDVLPVSMMTAFWASARLSDWFHFLNLRMDAHAQWETRYVANNIASEIRKAYPKSYELWEKYARGPINEFGTIQTP